MAAIQVYVRNREASAGIDLLCPQCFLPSVVVYTLERIDLDGITPLGDRLACRDEKIWIGPLKELTS